MEAQTQDQKATDSVSQESEQPQLPVDLSNVNPESIQMAEKAGIPISQIINWMQTVEERFAVIQKEMPEVIQKTINNLVAERQRQYNQQVAQSQGGGGGAIGGIGIRDLVGLASAFGGGGGENKIVSDLLQTMLQKSMVGIDLSNALTRAFIYKIAPRMGEEMMKGIEIGGTK